MQARCREESKCQCKCGWKLSKAKEPWFHIGLWYRYACAHLEQLACFCNAVVHPPCKRLLCLVVLLTDTQGHFNKYRKA